MEPQELAQLMRQLTDDAKVFVNTEFKITLDDSWESAAKVDEVVTELQAKHKHELADPQTIYTLSTMLGAYVGELFRQRFGGEWVQEVTENDAPMLLLKFENASYAFPGIAYQQLTATEPMSISEYLENAKNNHK